MTAVGEPATKIKVIADAVSRGGRLVSAIRRTSGAAAGVHVLEMFTNLLPNAHGVANDLFAADVARIRKSLGGVHISSTGVAMGLGYGQPLLPGPPPPPLFPGGSAIGIPPPPASTAIATWQGMQHQAPRPPRPVVGRLVMHKERLGIILRDRPVGTRAVGDEDPGVVRREHRCRRVNSRWRPTYETKRIERSSNTNSQTRAFPVRSTRAVNVWPTIGTHTTTTSNARFGSARGAKKTATGGPHARIRRCRNHVLELQVQ